MNRSWILLASCLPTLCFAEPSPGPQDANSWSQWRGPKGNGTSPSADPPLTWTEDKNIRWKTVIPGRGNSSPVVSGDLIFLTTVIPTGEEVEPTAGRRPGEHDNTLKVRNSKFVVLAVSRKTGKILWQTPVREQHLHLRCLPTQPVAT
jgi:outer membrane protein assembly factor BamB